MDVICSELTMCKEQNLINILGLLFKSEKHVRIIRIQTAKEQGVMIKVDLEHNISSLKIPQLRLDPQITILALKEIIEKRYGSEPPYIRLTLKNKKGDILTQMEEDMRTLSFYGASNQNIISVMDLNPNSIHKEIQNTANIEKYTMSEETYQQLPQNFRKWKHQFLEENPQIVNTFTGQTQICDPDYLKHLAETMQVGQRCQLENGARGQIRFIGRAIDIGYGFFIGIELDESIGGYGNGTVEGNYYFFCEEGKAYFERPNKIEVGQFPKIEGDDEI